jgi:outer membrane protein OmpA-like peptidoglycan-associated protein
VRAPVALVALSVLVLIAGMAHAQDEKGKILDLQGKIIDLKERVESTGGKQLALEMKETAEDIRIDLAADVLFDFDKADIRPEASATLKEVAEVIRKQAKGGVVIVGHTDAKGTDTYNQTLSQRRANAVRDWLVKDAGLSGVAFQTSGQGARKPVASNTKPDGSDDPEGRQKNRRVEITVRKR